MSQIWLKLNSTTKTHLFTKKKGKLIDCTPCGLVGQGNSGNIAYDQTDVEQHPKCKICAEEVVRPKVEPPCMSPSRFHARREYSDEEYVAYAKKLEKLKSLTGARHRWEDIWAAQHAWKKSLYVY